jgi:hypothetical protein
MANYVHIIGICFCHVAIFIHDIENVFYYMSFFCSIIYISFCFMAVLCRIINIIFYYDIDFSITTKAISLACVFLFFIALHFLVRFSIFLEK